MNEIIEEQSTCEIDANGDKRWYLNGKVHRTDGPAVECADGSKFWWLNGKLHRTDGPSAEWESGRTFWYLNDTHYSLEDYCKELYNDKWEMFYTALSLKYE